MDLIINADDFGYSHGRNAGIVKCFTSGLLSSATLLVNGVEAEEAVQMARKHKLPMGMHLNLTEGSPITSAVLQTIVGSDGYFLGKMGFREAVKNGKIEKDEILMEIEAQIEKFRALTGQIPTHVDGHQHVHILPNICKLFASTLSKFNIHRTRLPIDLDVHGNPRCTSDFLISVVKDAVDAKPVFDSFTIRGTHYFLGLELMGADSSVNRVMAQVSDILLSGPENAVTYGGRADDVRPTVKTTCEWMVHPGYITGVHGGCGAGPDLFSQSPDREHEMSVLCQSSLRQFFRDNDITLCTFNDIKVA